MKQKTGRVTSAAGIEIKVERSTPDYSRCGPSFRHGRLSRVPMQEHTSEKDPQGATHAERIKDATTDPEQITAWFTKWPNALIGVEKMIVIDLDKHPGKPDGHLAVPDWRELSPVIFETWREGHHLVFAWDETIASASHPDFPGVELRAVGWYTIVPPSEGYNWFKGSLADLANLPPLPDRFRGWSGNRRPGTSSKPKRKVALKPIHDSLAKLVAANPVHQPEVVAEAEAWHALLKRAYDVIPNDDLARDVWDERTATLYNATGGTDAGLKIALDFARKSNKHHNESTVIDRWRHWDRSPYTRFHAESIFHWAWEEAGDFWWRDYETEAAPETDAESSAHDSEAKDEGPSTQDDADQASAKEPLTPDWPTMGDAAYHGIIGEVVRTIEPESEADPVAILIQLIVAVGSMIGRQAYYQVESDKHHANLFAAAVGETSKARKGTAWGRVRDVCYHADQEWVLRHIGSGLSSGEGLIHQVRDRVTKSKDGKEEVVDAGVSDKRFMAMEAELSGLLKVMERGGNTISPLFRKAWDGGDLQTLTRNNSLKATEPHISSIGHITIDELRSCLTRTDAANGFANRFLFFLVRRSKELPMGGNLDDETIKDSAVGSVRAINHLIVGADGVQGAVLARRRKAVARGLRSPDQGSPRLVRRHHGAGRGAGDQDRAHICHSSTRARSSTFRTSRPVWRCGITASGRPSASSARCSGTMPPTPYSTASSGCTPPE